MAAEDLKNVIAKIEDEDENESKWTIFFRIYLK